MVQPFFDLGGILPLLAESIQGAVAALYNIETAAINTRPSLSPDKFNADRHRLSDLWEKIKRFLQGCYAYAEDFVSLGTFLKTRTVEECSGFLDSISSAAGRRSRDAKRLLKNYDTKFQKTQKHVDEVARLFFTSSETTPRRQSTVIARRTPTFLNATPLFAPAVSASFNPGGSESIIAFSNASSDIRRHLCGLVGFWTDESVALSVKRNTPRPRPTDLRRNADKWKAYQPLLMSAIASIAGSSSAIMVHPVAAPRSIATDPTRRPAGCRTVSVWLRSVERNSR